MRETGLFGGIAICASNDMNIYEKLLEIATQHPEKNIFDEESALGMLEIKKILAEKQKESLLLKHNDSEYILARTEKEIKDVLIKQYGDGVVIEIPPGDVDADFAIPCFRIAKEQNKKPNDLAQEMVSMIVEKKINGISSVIAVGGYVNIELDKEILATNVFHSIDALKETYGSSQEGKNKTVVIEYSSPNAAKPMSVGHLRSTIIGESLKRIYEFGGYTVIGINHFGDFGTQFGKFLYAFIMWKDKEQYIKNPVHEMLRLYVKFHEEAEKDPELDEKARELFYELEKGDNEYVKMWLEACVASVADTENIYNELDVHIDLLLGESSYENKLAHTAMQCLEKKIAVKNEDGSVAVSFTDESMPSFLLQKKDGSSLYALRDIAAAQLRVKEFNPAKIMYVVGGEQTLHFRQVFKTLGLMGYDENVFVHDGFGMVSLPEGKMSTRAGRVVFLEDVIIEGKKRAKKLVEVKNPDLTEEEKNTIARAVGVGALIYDDLSQSRERNITFSWEKALSMEGDSAPYIQYGYARAGSILRKSEEEIDLENVSDVVIETKREVKLIQLLARFPHVVQQARANDAPHVVAVYANTLTQEFNRFYNEDEVLTAQGNIKTTRLVLVKATMQIMHNALSLLNIKTLERM